MDRIARASLVAAVLGVAACGGRSAPSLWWTLSNQNNQNGNGNSNSNVPLDCGNGVLDPSEPCDGWLLGDNDCYTLGYDGGELACSRSCTLDPSRCWICGDGICDEGEWWECPWDCEDLCGDGICQQGEEEWCPEDCQGWCGNEICEPGEQEWCPEDCESFCGNGLCDQGEQALTCPEDCRGWCGDRICDLGEASWCPADCQSCGNGVCEEGEWQWCIEDCPNLCGNGICEPVESPASCPEDCGTCGDGQCAQGEETWCPQDCGTSSTLSCQGISLCMLCCSANDPDCRTACRTAGSSQARSEYTQYRACAQNLCASVCTGGAMTYDCLLCARVSCTGICGFGAAGQEGCNALVTCTGGCAEVGTGGNSLTCPGDLGVQCRNGCWAQGDIQASTLYEALMSCIAASCGTVCASGSSAPGCQTCIYQNCGGEAGSCLGD